MGSQLDSLSALSFFLCHLTIHSFIHLVFFSPYYEADTELCANYTVSKTDAVPVPSSLYPEQKEIIIIIIGTTVTKLLKV